MKNKIINHEVDVELVRDIVPSFTYIGVDTIPVSGAPCMTLYSNIS